MSLIVLEQASLSFGDRDILNRLNLRVGEQDQIGVIGPNGSGKSTLLKAMCGQQGLDGGQVRLAKHCRIGYLPQDILEVGGDTLLSSVVDSIPGRGHVEEDLLQAETSLEKSTDPEEQLRLAHLLSSLHERLDRYETYYSSQRAITILMGLGFREGDLPRPTAEFSGGWKMRAALAALLFQDTDVLFLDEPTNHLDLPSVAWLDEYLKGCRSSLVLICHDREFLNRHIQRVVSFEPEGVRTYAGNYDSYKELRLQEEEVLEASARNRDREIKELERFVERFRYKATKARQAQNRSKKIEKLQKEIDKPIIRPKRLRFSFPPTKRSGKDAMNLEGLCKSFGDLELYRDLNQRVASGDRIAIVGLNGAGKTTLLKMMAGELQPDSGSIRLGSNVVIGYYAQHHTELLDPQRSVLEEVWNLAPGSSQSYVRGVCGAFLFSGDDVDKAVGVLSGGERARVLLALLLIKPTNLLLMDEPTNHLDVDSAEALAEALKTFGGTLIFVSHNKSFINHLATKIWEVGEGQVIEYPGNLDDYLFHRQLQAQSSDAPEEELPQADPEGRRQHEVKKNYGSREEQKERKRREAEQRNALNRRTRKIREEISGLERRIAKLEARQAELEPKLADPEFYQQPDFKDALREYEDNRHKVEELYSRWQHQQESLEQVEAKFAAEATSA